MHVRYEVILISRILENAVPFATGNFHEMKPEILVEWKALVLPSTDWNFEPPPNTNIENATFGQLMFTSPPSL